LSEAFGVGHHFTASFSVIDCLVPLGLLPVGLFFDTRPPLPMLASGVGHIAISTGVGVRPCLNFSLRPVPFAIAAVGVPTVIWQLGHFCILGQS
jgi:hypothetical protein